MPWESCALPPIIFDRVELRDNLISQNLTKLKTQQGKYSEIWICFDLSLPTLGTLARHIHVEVCYRNASHVSTPSRTLLPKFFEFRSTSGKNA